MRKLAIIAFATLAVTSIVGYMVINRGSPTEKAAAPTPLKSMYSLKLATQRELTSGQASNITFTIRDQNEKSLQKTDTAHGQAVHVFAIRKDRTNFQHVHPSYDATNDTYTLSNIAFPADGEYRLFVDFTLSASPVDAEKVKIPTTLSSDVSVGNADTYQAQRPIAEKLISTNGSLKAEIFDAPNDGGGSGYTSEVTSSLPIFISKNDQDYTGYQDNFGEFGYFVAISPALALVHAYPNTTTKSYLMGFNTVFPTAGLYAAYLQLKDENSIRTMDFTINVR